MLPKCPICKLEFQRELRSEFYGDDRVTIDCPRCKKFIITGTAQSIAKEQELGPKLSAWVRNRNEQGAEVPIISSDTLKDFQAGLPDYSPREKQIVLLQNIERMTEYPGKTVKIITKYDIPLAWASTEEELRYYLQSLIEQGLLIRTSMELGDVPIPVVITADGWDYLEKQERHIEQRTQAFVAMSFKEDMKSVWQGPIFNAITKAGYKPYRVDAEPHSNLIDV